MGVGEKVLISPQHTPLKICVSSADPNPPSNMIYLSPDYVSAKDVNVLCRTVKNVVGLWFEIVFIRREFDE